MAGREAAARRGRVSCFFFSSLNRNIFPWQDALLSLQAKGAFASADVTDQVT